MKLLIFDATRKPSLLDEGWAFGSFSMWLRQRMDGFLGATSWQEVLNWLEYKEDVTELQFWGHGSPGEVFINGKGLLSMFINDELDYSRICDSFKRDATVWFRTCSTFHGKKGKEFADDMSQIFNCVIAGHTYKIGFPSHSGLHTYDYRIGKYSWSDEEGKSKTGTQKSCFYKPNTISFLRNTIPKGW